MDQIDLQALGFDAFFAAEAARYPRLRPGRVFSQAKALYQVRCATGELTAEVSGKFRYAAQSPAAFPAVGDFVLLDRDDDAAGNAVIHRVLTRKSAFVRKAAGSAAGEQVVASNIDTVFICMALQRDFNLRRLERYLSIGWDSGATPVIVLTKSDLCDDLARRLADIGGVAPGVDTLATSSLDEDGVLSVLPYLRAGRTVAFVGSSGVGKSTLINRLLGENRLDTGGLRNDAKGRHTTTRREIHLLANGCLVVDTPGMRELGLERADLSATFADIDALAAACKFRDCAHAGEPGCAVQSALFGGSLSAERLESYRKLKREARYDGLQSRQIEAAKLQDMFADCGGMKQARKFLQEKSRRR